MSVAYTAVGQNDLFAQTIAFPYKNGQLAKPLSLYLTRALARGIVFLPHSLPADLKLHTQ